MSGKRAGRAVAAVHLGLFIVALGIDVGLIVMSGKLLSQWKLLGSEGIRPYYMDMYNQAVASLACGVVTVVAGGWLLRAGKVDFGVHSVAIIVGRACIAYATSQGSGWTFSNTTGISFTMKGLGWGLIAVLAVDVLIKALFLLRPDAAPVLVDSEAGDTTPVETRTPLLTPFSPGEEALPAYEMVGSSNAAAYYGAEGEPIPASSTAQKSVYVPVQETGLKRQVLDALRAREKNGVSLPTSPVGA